MAPTYGAFVIDPFETGDPSVEAIAQQGSQNSGIQVDNTVSDALGGRRFLLAELTQTAVANDYFEIQSDPQAQVFVDLQGPKTGTSSSAAGIIEYASPTPLSFSPSSSYEVSLLSNIGLGIDAFIFVTLEDGSQKDATQTLPLVTYSGTPFTLSFDNVQGTGFDFDDIVAISIGFGFSLSDTADSTVHSASVELFNFQQVPEPSEYAMIIGAGSLLLLYFRKRKTKQ